MSITNFYYEIQIPTSKQLHHHYIDKTLEAFKLDDSPTLLIDHLSGYTEQNVTHEYKKKKHVLNPSSRIDVISKDGYYDFFTWRTNAKNVHRAVRYGIVATQSLTGQVIATLGKYRCIGLERIKNGYVSNRQIKKDSLVEMYQERFEALSELESLVNSHCSKEEYVKAINQYINTLLNLKKSHNQQAESIEKDIQAVNHFFKSNKTESAFLATGTSSLLTFVKERMICNLKELQSENQSLTYNRKSRFALTRGDLNSQIEYALILIEKYYAPPSDKISKSHHGLFGKEEDKVVFESNYHCANHQEERRALLAISFIEKSHRLINKNQHSCELYSGENTKPVPLKIIHATKWYFNSVFSSMFNIIAWFINISIKLAFGIIELPFTIIIEPLTFGYIPGFFNGLRRLAMSGISNKNHFHENLNATYQMIDAEITRTEDSLGLRIRRFSENAFRNTIRDFIYAAQDIGRKLTTNLFNAIISDYRDGRSKKLETDAVLASAKNEMIEIEERKHDALLSVLKKADPTTKYIKEVSIPNNIVLARPNYYPNQGISNDPSNSGASLVDHVFGLFVDNVHATHPFGGAIFSLTYIVGGLAILAPSAISFLGPNYIAGSQALGYGFSKDFVTAAISSGCTQAQILTAQYELLLNGPNSWLVKAASSFEKDPFTSLIYATTALALGDLIVYELRIPWISDVLREDMGNVPTSSLGFVGAKLAIGVYEILKDEDEVKLQKNDYINPIETILNRAIKEKHPKFTESQVKNLVNEVIQKIKSPEYLKALRSLLKGDNQKLNLTNITEKDIDRASILLFLSKNASDLPYMSSNAKYELFNIIRENFNYKDARSLEKLITPEKHLSILHSLAAILVGYLSNTIRLIFSLFSTILQGSLMPLRSALTDFGSKILLDLTRIVRAMSKLFKVGISFIRRHIKTVGDILFNSTVGRLEAIIFGSNYITKLTYSISAWFDQLYERVRQFLSAPIDLGMRLTTPAQPEAAFESISNSYMKCLPILSTNKNQDDKLDSIDLSLLDSENTKPDNIKKLNLTSEPAVTTEPTSRQSMSLS